MKIVSLSFTQGLRDIHLVALSTLLKRWRSLYVYEVFFFFFLVRKYI